MRCHGWFPTSAFEPHSKAADGLKVHCKKCTQFFWKARRNNLTPAQLEALIEDHGGVCAICGTRPKEGGLGLAIDHDHACCPRIGQSCGKCIRGLLCGNCNTALGSFKDDPRLLRAAIDYLAATPWEYSSSRP